MRSLVGPDVRDWDLGYHIEKLETALHCVLRGCHSACWHLGNIRKELSQHFRPLVTVWATTRPPWTSSFRDLLTKVMPSLCPKTLQGQLKMSRFALLSSMVELYSPTEKGNNGRKRISSWVKAHPCCPLRDMCCRV